MDPCTSGDINKLNYRQRWDCGSNILNPGQRAVIDAFKPDMATNGMIVAQDTGSGKSLAAANVFCKFARKLPDARHPNWHVYWITYDRSSFELQREILKNPGAIDQMREFVENNIFRPRGNDPNQGYKGVDLKTPNTLQDRLEWMESFEKGNQETIWNRFKVFASRQDTHGFHLNFHTMTYSDLYSVLTRDQFMNKWDAAMTPVQLVQPWSLVAVGDKFMSLSNTLIIMDEAHHWFDDPDMQADLTHEIPDPNNPNMKLIMPGMKITYPAPAVGQEPLETTYTTMRDLFGDQCEALGYNPQDPLKRYHALHCFMLQSLRFKNQHHLNNMSKIMFLTATPMMSRPQQLIEMMNMLLVNPQVCLTTRLDFYMTPQGQQALAEMCRSHVSYLSMNNDPSKFAVKVVREMIYVPITRLRTQLIQSKLVEFITQYCTTHQCTPEVIINRIMNLSNLPLLYMPNSTITQFILTTAKIIAKLQLSPEERLKQYDGNVATIRSLWNSLPQIEHTDTLWQEYQADPNFEPLPPYPVPEAQLAFVRHLQQTQKGRRKTMRFYGELTPQEMARYAQWLIARQTAYINVTSIDDGYKKLVAENAYMFISHPGNGALIRLRTREEYAMLNALMLDWTEAPGRGVDALTNKYYAFMNFNRELLNQLLPIIMPTAAKLKEFILSVDAKDRQAWNRPLQHAVFTFAKSYNHQDAANLKNQQDRAAKLVEAKSPGLANRGLRPRSYQVDTARTSEFDYGALSLLAAFDVADSHYHVCMSFTEVALPQEDPESKERTQFVLNVPTPADPKKLYVSAVLRVGIDRIRDDNRQEIVFGPKHKKAVLQAYKEKKIQVLIVDGIYLEAMDTNDTSHAYFVQSPLKSTQFKQAVGRFARYAKSQNMPRMNGFGSALNLYFFAETVDDQRTALLNLLMSPDQSWVQEIVGNDPQKMAAVQATMNEVNDHMQSLSLIDTFTYIMQTFSIESERIKTDPAFAALVNNRIKSVGMLQGKVKEVLPGGFVKVEIEGEITFNNKHQPHATQEMVIPSGNVEKLYTIGNKLVIFDENTLKWDLVELKGIQFNEQTGDLISLDVVRALDQQRQIIPASIAHGPSPDSTIVFTLPDGANFGFQFAHHNNDYVIPVIRLEVSSPDSESFPVLAQAMKRHTPIYPAATRELFESSLAFIIWSLASKCDKIRSVTDRVACTIRDNVVPIMVGLAPVHMTQGEWINHCLYARPRSIYIYHIQNQAGSAYILHYVHNQKHYFECIDMSGSLPSSTWLNMQKQFNDKKSAMAQSEWTLVSQDYIRLPDRDERDRPLLLMAICLLYLQGRMATLIHSYENYSENTSASTPLALDSPINIMSMIMRVMGKDKTVIFLKTYMRYMQDLDQKVNDRKKLLEMLQLSTSRLYDREDDLITLLNMVNEGEEPNKVPDPRNRPVNRMVANQLANVLVSPVVSNPSVLPMQPLQPLVPAGPLVSGPVPGPAPGLVLPNVANPTPGIPSTMYRPVDLYERARLLSDFSLPGMQRRAEFSAFLQRQGFPSTIEIMPIENFALLVESFEKDRKAMAEQQRQMDVASIANLVSYWSRDPTIVPLLIQISHNRQQAISTALYMSGGRVQSLEEFARLPGIHSSLERLAITFFNMRYAFVQAMESRGKISAKDVLTLRNIIRLPSNLSDSELVDYMAPLPFESP